MDKLAFDTLFRDRALEKLEPLGFRFLGKTVAFRDEAITVSLIRLRGRASVAGGVAHVLCFRHSFLRGLHDETVPSGIPTEVFDYPFKFMPSELRGSPDTSWRYVPRNLSYPHESYLWSEFPDAAVGAWVNDLMDLIGTRFLPWVRTLGAAGAASQLRTLGEDAWCERLWLEDYAQSAEKSRPAKRRS